MNEPTDDRTRREGLNDLSGTSKSRVSIEDNSNESSQTWRQNFNIVQTENPKGRKKRDGVPGSQMRPEGTKTIRRNTLSVYGKDLEEARRQLAAKIENQVFADNSEHKTKTLNYNKKNPNIFENSEAATSNPDEGQESKGRKSENVYAKYVQQGDRNLMLITEPLEATSQTCYKQIGNKNVVVHLNVISNLCQLVDKEKGIIPLDNKGEVWLEIKIRSTDSSSRSDYSSSTNSFSSASSYRKAPQHSEGKDRKAQEHDESLPNDLNDRLKLNNPYEENNFKNINKRRSAAEHSDTCDTNVVEENIDDLYSTVSCQENDDSLQIKFEKGVDYRTLKTSEMSNFPLLSHQKVIEFLTNKSNCFDECDVSVCNWEYETESVYENYAKIADVSCTDDYAQVREAAPFCWRPEPGEHSASTSGYSDTKEQLSPDYSIASDHNKRELYSLPCKKRQPLKTPPVPVPRPQASPTVEQTPDLPPRQPSGGHKRHPRSPIEPPHNHPPWQPMPVESPSEIRPPRLGSSEEKRRQKTLELTHVESPTRPLPPPPPSPINNLLQFPWYHGNVEKIVARRRLTGKPHGSFLVRKATGQEPSHMYTIDLIDEGIIKKLMIMKTSGQYHFKEFEIQQRFASVEDLVQTIMRSGLEVKDSRTGQWKTITVRPIQRE